jgi:hypothetical protein
MTLRRRKSRKRQVADLFASYLKFKAVKKTAEGARKAAKGTAAYQVAKRTPLVPAVPAVAGAGILAVVAAKVLRGGGHHDEPVPA